MIKVRKPNRDRHSRVPSNLLSNINNQSASAVTLPKMRKVKVIKTFNHEIKDTKEAQLKEVGTMLARIK